MTDGLSADDVREMVFGRPPWGKRGYNEDAVDAFLVQIARRIDGRGSLTAADVRNVGFPSPKLFRRGYNEDEVDAFLEEAEATIAGLERR